MSINWRTYGKDTIASRLDSRELPGFFRKKVVIPPGEAGVVIKGGIVEQRLSEGTVEVTGFKDKFLSWFGADEKAEVVFFDISPFDIPIFLGTRAVADAGSDEQNVSTETGERSTVSHDASDVMLTALSKDGEAISAECRARVSVSLEDPARIIGLMGGDRALASWDVAALIRSEIVGPVLLPLIAAHDAAEFRGSAGVRDQIVTDAKARLTDNLTSRGIVLNDFTIAWGLTEAEADQLARNRVEREDAWRDFDHKRSLMEMQRDQEIQRTEMVNLQELRVAETQGDEEMKDFLLACEIGRELKVEGKRVDIAGIDAQVRKINLEVDQRESEMRLERRRQEETLRLDVEEREFRQSQQARLAKIDADDKEMASMVRMQIEMASAKHEREMAARRQEIDAENRRQQMTIESDYQNRKARLDEDLGRMGMQERLVSQGLAAGATESSVLKTMLEQQTEQSVVTGSDAKVEAREAAKAAKHNLDTFKEAEDRERDHQKDMTQLSTDMMQGAKQDPASPIIVPNPGASASSGGGSGPVNIVNVPGGTPPPQPQDAAAAPASSVDSCGSCGTAMQPDWKVCPSCGKPRAAIKSFCTDCAQQLEPDWKACPKCGKAV
jgi:RNA polymerase subunit RPABC4/transcription elongation factor Spt4